MKITIKDVGQGDSILLQWHSESGKLQVGVIDCNLKDKNNPILDALKLLSDFDFKFIILSHPHTDHYSGLLDLLSYIKDSNIHLELFLHTCGSEVNHILQAVRSVTYKNKLLSIFRLATELNKTGLINEVGTINSIYSLSLTTDINLKVLYPNNSLISSYNSIAFKDKTVALNNPDANLLSTVIKISVGNFFILLTSDAVLDLFWEHNRRGNKHLEGSCVVSQIPHHGSKDNFLTSFWKTLKKATPIYAAISVGKK